MYMGWYVYGLVCIWVGIVTLKHCLFAVFRGLTETVIMEIQTCIPTRSLSICIADRLIGIINYLFPATGIGPGNRGDSSVRDTSLLYSFPQTR